VAKQIVVNDVVLGEESGFENNRTIHFNIPRTVDYRANTQDIAKYLLKLLEDEKLRVKMGAAGRERAVAHFDYKVVTKKFLQILQDRLGIK